MHPKITKHAFNIYMGEQMQYTLSESCFVYTRKRCTTGLPIMLFGYSGAEGKTFNQS